MKKVLSLLLVTAIVYAAVPYAPPPAGREKLKSSFHFLVKPGTHSASIVCKEAMPLSTTRNQNHIRHD
jgi:hypothetical protein